MVAPSGFTPPKTKGRKAAAELNAAAGSSAKRSVASDTDGFSKFAPELLDVFSDSPNTRKLLPEQAKDKKTAKKSRMISDMDKKN
mmetsp:Transcript_76116/g.134674  ORF Transcript_76116/g.134674 Transcript_76116/m.134674 type:complete len:85 (+) Transcript_76116:195-449(+)